MLLGNRTVATSRQVKISGAATERLSIKVANAKTWDEFRPQLYRLQTDMLSADGKLLDRLG